MTVASEPPVRQSHGLIHFTDGSLAYAGHYLHEHSHPDHTHSFLEIAVMTGGAGVHRSATGRHRLHVGDVVLLRPGVWHGYEQCHALDLYNCCFSTDLLHRELGWTRDDPLLGYLLWTGPYAMDRRGMITATLDVATLHECVRHLDALHRTHAAAAAERHRADIIGHLSLFLGCLARAVSIDQAVPPADIVPLHPAVSHTMHLLETDLARRWTLQELAATLHLTPSYLVRLFRSSTGLPPIAYLSRHRVEAAATMLLHSDATITQIARSVGWPDPNHFARRFRSHYGLSASEYRARFGRTGAGS